MRLKNKLLDIVLVLSVLLVTLVGYLFYCALFTHREKPRAADKKIEFVIEPVEQPKDWREQLRALYDTTHKVYWEEGKNKTIGGHTNFVTRNVYIRINLYELEEVLVYAHELTHLKYFSGNETFVTYQAIITLYESGIPYFRYVALYNARNIVNYHSYNRTAYDCGWLLQQYFEKGE